MARTEGQKQSRKHEDRLAKLVNGKTVSGSGAPWSHDGDVRADDVLIEHKYTTKKSFAVSRQLWDKLFKEAWKIGKVPVLGLHISGLNLVVLDESDYLELREKAASSA